jgi:hypothetical protein|nr:MAG TPA: hypothetical protein [Bacteriophage sp.]
MKRKIKDEDKEYLVIKNIASPIYVGFPTPNVKVFYLTEEELRKELEETGNRNIVGIFKNKPIDVETIIKIKD